LESHRFYLAIAMQEAEIAFNNKTYPVGAVIVGPNGEVISQGHNHVYNEGIFTSHAEIEAIRSAGDQLMRRQNFESCTLYTTLEPCLMCCGAIIHARITHVIWIKDDETHGALRSLHDHADPLSSFYVGKFDALKISRASEYDLARCMDTWMDNWNRMKETALSKW
jgi:tRNA(adenine34) deaminase